MPTMILTADLKAIKSVLAETYSLTLATLDPKNGPWATPLFFAVGDQLSLVFLSDPQSHHSRNLARNPQAACGLYPEVSDWQEIRGIQMQGVVTLAAGNAKRQGLAVYRKRFPFIGMLAEVVKISEVYRLDPSWIRLIDNRLGFGHRQEWQLEE